MSELSQSGDVKTVLVFGQGESSVAVTATVTARVVSEHAAPALAVAGPVKLDDQLQTHVRDTLVPMCNRVCALLGVGPSAFEVSVSNVGAASSLDTGVTIGGYSADAGVFVAMLSASLAIPVGHTVAVTGHIASASGEVRMVRDIPAKLAGAAADASVISFVYPAEDDASMAVLQPGEADRIESALRAAPSRIRLVPVRDILELVQSVLPEEAVALGGFRTGFHDHAVPDSGEPDGLARLARHLASGGDARALHVLERFLVTPDGDAASQFIAEWVAHYVHRQCYPSGLGGKLYRLVNALPYHLRSRLPSVLLPPAACRALAQLASDGDFADYQHLLAAVTLKSLGPAGTAPTRDANRPPPAAADADGLLEAILAEIDPDRLALADVPPAW